MSDVHELWKAKFKEASGLEVINETLPFRVCAETNLSNYFSIIEDHKRLHNELTRALHAIPEVDEAPSHVLTAGQIKALDAMQQWSTTSEPYFVLRGFSGTGKSYVLSLVAKKFATHAILFTAPTNKATKVLKTLLPDYQCKTIYSALSLKMVAREDEMILTRSDIKFNLRGFRIIVVDESSMLNTELLGYIEEVSKYYRIKFLFVADFAQLPPVGEDMSPVADLTCSGASLTEVVRHNNQILTLATHIRKAIVNGKRLRPIDLSVFECPRSVWQLSPRAFDLRLQKAAAKGFHDTKAIAWRNKTVDYLNDIVRSELYGINPPVWMPGDWIVVTEPIGEGRHMLATIDDEGIISTVDEGVDLETNLMCYFISVRMETGTTINMRIIHERSVDEFTAQLGKLASDARKPGQGKLWQKFWGLKNRFNSIRHSYGITSHRSQGSTIGITFVDAGDILANPDRDTAYRCLYVAVSRASRKLYITGLPH